MVLGRSNKKIGESQIIQNNELTKRYTKNIMVTFIFVKYRKNKTHTEIRAFLSYNHIDFFLQTPPILVHFGIPISIQPKERF